MKDTSSLKYYLAKCKITFLFALLFSFFINVFSLAMPIYSMQVLDRVLSSGSIETLIFLSLIILLFFIFYGILNAVRSAVFLNISNWLDKRISPTIFDASIQNQDNTQSLQNLRDLQNVRSFFTSPSFALAFDAPFAVIFLLFIFFIHPINGIVTLVGGLIMLKMAFINEKMTKNLVEQNNKLQLQVTRDFEILSNSSESLKTMGMSENVKKSWQKSNQKFREANSKLAGYSNNISSTSKSIRFAIQMITTATSAVLVIYNKMSVGGIIAVSTLSGKALAPFDSAISLWKSFLTAKKSYDNLNEFLKKNSNKTDKIELPQIKGELLAEKVIYKIEKTDRIIIKGLSFKINAGESIAIIGPSASGKTTLLRLLSGIIKPQSGSIRLDGADLANQDFEKLGKYFGYLSQKIDLIKGSVKENIGRMNSEISDEKIIAAAKLCGIHEMILSLPEGYETVIDNNSMNLSAGQKQRIALARACFDEAKIIFLDEPNSNLDSEGEAALVNLLKILKEKKITLIMVTHKPAIAAVCDKIMVLKDGQIAAFDAAQNVLKAITNKS